jgi:plastocyanin
VTVHVADFQFTPATVNIQPGDMVHWVWDGGTHSTTSVSGSAESWNSGNLSTGATFDHTFTNTGTFAYFCDIHGFDNHNGTAGGMSGKVIVASAQPTVQSITVSPANTGMNVGGTRQFMAMATFSDNTTRDVTAQAAWTSTNTAVATITGAGLATARAAGSTTIQASFSGVGGSTRLTVTAPATPPRLKSERRVIIGTNPKTQVITFELTFTGGLNATAAQQVGHYRVTQPGATPASGPVKIAVKSAKYTAASNKVTLRLGTFSAKKSLTLTASGLLGANGAHVANFTTKL